jgi:hypothetical protein
MADINAAITELINNMNALNGVMNKQAEKVATLENDIKAHETAINELQYTAGTATAEVEDYDGTQEDFAYRKQGMMINLVGRISVNPDNIYEGEESVEVIKLNDNYGDLVLPENSTIFDIVVDCIDIDGNVTKALGYLQVLDYANLRLRYGVMLPASTNTYEININITYIS